MEIKLIIHDPEDHNKYFEIRDCLYDENINLMINNEKDEGMSTSNEKFFNLIKDFFDKEFRWESDFPIRRTHAYGRPYASSGSGRGNGLPHSKQVAINASIAV